MPPPIDNPIDEGFRKLGSGSEAVRREGASLLARMGPSVVPALCRGLEDEVLREGAAEALLLIGDEVVPGLIRALESPGAREAAGEVLVRIGPRAAAGLVQCATSGPPEVRGGALELLARIDEPAAQVGLAHALRSPDPRLRRAAADLVATLGRTDVLLSLCAGWGAWDVPVRLRLIDALGNHGDARALPTLLHAMQDGNRNVREDAIRALGEIGDPHAVPALVRVGIPHHEEERLAALVQIGAPAVPSLVASLDKGLWECLAAKALRRIGEPAVAALCDALSGRGARAARAARLLGEIGDPAALPFLLPLLGCPVPQLRIAAAVSCSQLGERDAGIVSSLMEALRQPYLTELSVPEVLQSLADLRLSDAAEQLLAYVTTRFASLPASFDAVADTLARMGSVAVPALVRALPREDPFWPVASTALGRIGTDAVPALCELLSGGTATTAEKAVALLVEIGDPSAALSCAAAALRPELGLRRKAFLALIRFRDPLAADALRPALHDPSPALRRLAAVTLVRCGREEPELLLLVLEALTSDDGTVRDESMRALQSIAERQPSLALRAALPELRRLTGPWSMQPAGTRRLAREAELAIEAATASARSLPVPAEAPVPGARELPLPGSSSRSGGSGSV